VGIISTEWAKLKDTREETNERVRGETQTGEGTRKQEGGNKTWQVKRKKQSNPSYAKGKKMGFASAGTIVEILTRNRTIWGWK